MSLNWADVWLHETVPSLGLQTSVNTFPSLLRWCDSEIPTKADAVELAFDTLIKINVRHFFAFPVEEKLKICPITPGNGEENMSSNTLEATILLIARDEVIASLKQQIDEMKKKKQKKEEIEHDEEEEPDFGEPIGEGNGIEENNGEDEADDKEKEMEVDEIYEKGKRRTKK
ncbi:hypothetical protein ABFS83_05G075500 [Erythranthe nasuta]